MDLLETSKLFKKEPLERMTMTADLKWFTLLQTRVAFGINELLC